MVKIEIDPITKRVLSFTKIQSNTLVYTTDIIMDENDLPENLEIPYICENGLLFEANERNCDNSIDVLTGKINELSKISDSEYLLNVILDGKSLDEAREIILSRKLERDMYINERISLIEAREKYIAEHYLEENRNIDSSIEHQYYSAVILLIKDENRYLKEWLDHHLALGFDHVYIYDNGSKEKVNDIVTEYPEETQSKITVVDWSGHHNHIQQDAYNHFMLNYKKEVRWGLFIDSDEFLRFTDGVTTSVNDFLVNYEDYTEIWGYEVEYNANGQEYYEDKSVRERFTQQTDVREGFYWKNFIQVNRIDSFLMHYAFYDPKKHQMFKNDYSNQDLFVIEHYYTKSWEEWQWKIKERGGADPNYHKALKEFFVYNPDMKHLDTGENAVQKYE